MGFNPNKITEFKDGITPQTGTRALGSLFNAEFNRLYGNDAYLKSRIDELTDMVSGRSSFPGSITVSGNISATNFRTTSQSSTFCGIGTTGNGTANVAVGQFALRSVTANCNVAVGTNALYACTAGYNNVAIGYQAGSQLTTGWNNILIGYSVNAPSPTSSNYLNIGNTIVGDLSQKTISIEGTVDSSGISTGTLVVKGGVGIAKKCNIGSSLRVGVALLDADDSKQTIGIGGSSTSFKLSVNTTTSDPYFVNSVGGISVGVTNNLASSACNTLSGISVNLSNSGLGNVLNSYGVYVVYSAVTNIANCYGLYVLNENKNYFSGRVGIGQLNPEYKLDVSGTARFTGDVILSKINSSFTCGNNALYVDIMSGNIGIGTNNIDSSGKGVLCVRKDTEPVSAINDCVQLFSATVSNAVTLGLFTQATPINETAYTKFSHKYPVKINGSVYYIMLTTT